MDNPQQPEPTLKRTDPHLILEGAKIAADVLGGLGGAAALADHFRHDAPPPEPPQDPQAETPPMPGFNE